MYHTVQRIHLNLRILLEKNQQHKTIIPKISPHQASNIFLLLLRHLARLDGYLQPLQVVHEIFC